MFIYEHVDMFKYVFLFFYNRYVYIKKILNDFYI